jgi:hypothetical protein
MYGSISMDDIRAYAADAISLSKKHRCNRFLNDVREARLEATISEIDDIPSYVSGLGLDSSAKRAMVVGAANAKLFFLKSASRIRQQNVALFKTVEDAHRWLLDGGERAPDDTLNRSSAFRIPAHSAEPDDD